jgi:hypothetical protein
LKFGEFRELCMKEWRDNKGDVTVLWLTQESYRELQEDSLGLVEGQDVLFKENGTVQPAARVIYNPAGNVSHQVGIRMNTIVNPVTRTPVRMKLARDMDVADVWVQGRVESRFLEPDAALDVQYRSAKWEDED